MLHHILNPKTEISSPRYARIALFRDYYTDVSQDRDVSEVAILRFYRAMFCLRQHPGLGRPWLVPGYTLVDPILQDKDRTSARHGYSVMM